MLLSFRFANHRSFRDEQQLNLTPVYGDDEGGDSRTLRAVRVAGVFGANASGKSNLLDALTFMRHLVLHSDREVEPGVGLVRSPFRLDVDGRESPSQYVVDLLLGGIRLTYGLAVDDERVTEEWLYEYTSPGRHRTIFERSGSIELGDSVPKRELSKITEITAPTALFLSTVARFGRRDPEARVADGPLHSVYRWFSMLQSRGRYENRYRSLQWPERQAERKVVASLIRAADVGITDVRLKPPIIDETETADTTDPAELNRRRKLASVRSRDRTRLEFEHRGPAGSSTVFGHADESTGTKQLLDLAIEASRALQVGGAMLIDEIDASLHPMLTASLIRLFQSPHTNKTGSQLIFTTHDATLLGNLDGVEVLGRDEIWFTEKDHDGVSRLYPLSDFKPRKEGENRQRRYLNGSYGGVPDLAWDLFEQALGARGEFDAS